tara:strand:- start:442 stop:636 length:195 start_codon:yes stop_codon:yes gene_type:complete
MIKNYLILFFYGVLCLFPFSASARCAVCYTQGMSGASIAVIILVTSFIILFIANKFLQKIINKE